MYLYKQFCEVDEQYECYLYLVIVIINMVITWARNQSSHAIGKPVTGERYVFSDKFLYDKIYLSIAHMYIQQNFCDQFLVF